jgi:hypothetical protein
MTERNGDHIKSDQSQDDESAPVEVDPAEIIRTLEDQGGVAPDDVLQEKELPEGPEKGG